MTLSTHVLDLGAGRPAAGVAALLLGPDGESVGSGQTDGDGRLGSEAECDPGASTLRSKLEGRTQL